MMLMHLNAASAKPRRVVVLGGSGFIAGAILRALQRSGVETVALGRPSLDLLAPDASERLARHLEPSDTLVFASALAPCKDLTMLSANLRMVEAVCAALRASPVGHLVYISSDAVYKDSSGPLSESSCAQPGSYHGLMHLAREMALRTEFSCPFVTVRPTLVYGLEDPHNGYGPNRFRRLASAGRDIVLFGEGEERRDHVYVEDVAEIVRLIVLHRSIGIVNAVSGDVVSFRELADFIASDLTPKVAVRTTPRTGPMPHNGYRAFDRSAGVEAFPGFAFLSWRAGLAKVHAQLKADQPANRTS
jgi:nucleoside-diphosphate-sugar epimerase